MERAVAEDALKREVVNGEHGRDVRKEWVGGIEAGQHVGNDRGVPIVDVDHVRLKPNWAQHLERGPAEVDESGVVVPETVHALAAEELLVFDEVDGHALPDPSLEHVGADRLMGQRHSHIAHDSAQAVLFHVDAAVTRHHHPNVVAHGAQGFGQRAGHVGQAADLGEWRHLGRDEENFQRLVLPPVGGVPRDPDRNRAGGWQLLHRFSTFIG